MTVSGRDTETSVSVWMRSVELLGLPGAGKSTLVERLGVRTDTALSVPDLIRRERLRRRPLRRHRTAMRVMPVSLALRLLTAPTPDAKDAAAFALAHREHLETVMRASLEVEDEPNRRLAVELLFESWSEHGYSERIARPGEWVIFHEAVLQRLAFLMALLPPRSEQAQRLVGAVPLPDAVVFLDLPLELAVERVLTRAREFTMTEVMGTMADALRSLRAKLEQHDVPMLLVDATQPPEASVEAVVRFLRSRPGS
jgi:CheY-like chemotaxis protein